MCICKFLRHLILENYKRRRRGGRGGEEEVEGVKKRGLTGVGKKRWKGWEEGGGKEGIVPSKSKPAANFLFGAILELSYCHC